MLLFSYEKELLLYLVWIATSPFFPIVKRNAAFSINLINEVYELTDSDSTFNSALWLFLEEKLQKELVVISNSQPTVVEPENFNTLYQVTINENNEDEKYTIEKFYIEQ